MEYDMPIMSISEKGQVVIPKELRDKYGIATDGEVMSPKSGATLRCFRPQKIPSKHYEGQ